MKKIKKLICYIITLLFLLVTIVGCTSSNKKVKSGNIESDLKGNISISGAFALYPLTVKWAEEYNKIHPQVQIDISAGGAGKGMTDVLSQMVDLAMFSREVSPQEEEKGAWKIAVAKDAVFPTINAGNPAIANLQKRGLTKEQFKQLFTGENQKYWNQFTGYSSNEKINVYTRSDACGAAAMWAKFFDREQEDLKGTGIFGDPGMADAVKNDINGVGYNNLIYIYDIKTKKIIEGLNIIPVDLNENGTIDPEENVYETMSDAMTAIRKNVYPSPPARNLYLISKGEPDNPAVISFLQFILTEGQKMIPETGYVQLEESSLIEEAAKLNIKNTGIDQSV